MLKTKEYYELLLRFDREYKSLRLDKEPKELWSKGAVYQDGLVNRLFCAYQKGYALGKAVA